MTKNDQNQDLIFHMFGPLFLFLMMSCDRHVEHTIKVGPAQSPNNCFISKEHLKEADNFFRKCTIRMVKEHGSQRSADRCVNLTRHYMCFNPFRETKSDPYQGMARVDER